MERMKTDGANVSHGTITAGGSIKPEKETSQYLENWAALIGTARKENETDEQLRTRILNALQENKA